MLCMSMGMFAQSSLLATLSHEGNITIFHGATSLKEALAAADHGDIITLASGRYNAVDINKAITLRGAGMEDDSISNSFTTQIVGGFTIQIPDSIKNHHLSIEGIYNGNTITIRGTLNNAMLQKSRFYRIGYYSYINTVKSLSVIHCRITDYIQIPQNSSATFINSYVGAPNCNQTNATMEFTNCYIEGDYDHIYRSKLTNCILHNASYANALSNTNMPTYCVAFIRNGGNAFANVTAMTNTVLSKADYDAMFKANTFFELTDEAKAKYVGSDGTEIGLYGGNLPYSWRILSPEITKCNVAAKTTADGKLSVDIEVKAAE